MSPAPRLPASELALGLVLARARQRLTPLSDTASLDAQVLLAHLLDRPRSWLLAHPEYHLDAAQAAALEESLASLEAGIPLPYVLGSWEFFGRSFKVTPAVLIPRPETELLIEHTLAWLSAHPAARRGVDVGTGSGCIAVTLAAEVPDLHILAVDLSPAALEVARENAARHGVTARVDFLQADLLEGVPTPFDFTCANLPYIPSAALSSLPVSRHEPVLALDGGPDGLTLIRRLLAQLARRASPPPAALFIEIEASQGEAVLLLARQTFPTPAVHLHQDLAGRDRLLTILPPP